MRLLVTGAGGQLGTELMKQLAGTAHHGVTGFTHAQLDVASRDQVLAAVAAVEPEAVVHTAAWTDVDGCEADPDRAWATNALGTRHVVEAARVFGARVVYLSTDYVFDGTLDRAYTEWDMPNPLSVYGASKLGGERELDPSDTLIRTSWVCGRQGRSFVSAILDRAAQAATGALPPLRVVDDQRGCLTVAEDLATEVIRLVVAHRRGIFHVTNQGPTSRYELAREIVAAAGLDPELVTPISTSQLDPQPPARRPASAVLDNAALRLEGMPLLDHHADPLRRLVASMSRP